MRTPSVAATLCMVSAAAAMTGLLTLSTLGQAPASHSLMWFAVAAFGCSAPLAFAGYVMSLLPTQAFASTENGHSGDGSIRFVPIAIDAGAAAGVSGLFAGTACMTTALLFGADNTHLSGWPIYAYAVVFALLASALVRDRLAVHASRRAFEPIGGAMPVVQLVADNTRPWQSLGRVKAFQKRRLRIDPFAESELHDFSRKYGCTPDELRAACMAVGTLADDVAAHLARQRERGQH